MKFEDMTVRQLVDVCYNTKYCAEYELRTWCNNYCNVPPTDWEVKGYMKYWIGAITAEELNSEDYQNFKRRITEDE